MEFLRRLVEPLLDRLRWLPISSRMAGIAFGLITVAGLWLTAGRPAATDFVALLDGRDLSEPQIARMTSAFRKHRLDGARIAGAVIEIPRAEQEAYLSALEQEDAWPAAFDDPVDRALANTNPLMPWQQSRESLMRGEKQMLARIVEEMNGIESAAVQYDEIRQPGFPPRIEVRAVVAVKATGRRHLELEEIEAIRDTVVAFKSGLKSEDVTITDLNACRAYPGQNAADTSQAACRVVATAKRNLEDELRAKIRQRLSMYPGVVVAVNAHFAETLSAGLLAGDLAARSSGVARLVQVTASIDVPRSYFVAVCRQRYGIRPDQAPPPEQIDKIAGEICGNIERAVAAMLPPPAPGWQTPQPVTVTSHDELQPAADRVATIWDWPSAGWLAAVATMLTGAAFWLARIYLCRRRRCRTAAPARSADADSAAACAESTPPATRSDLSPAFVELREQLRSLVKRDPSLAAETLKQWLSRAA